MRKLLIILIALLCYVNMVGQHNPKNFVIGAELTAPFSDIEFGGATVQLNYASNCYTTFVNELSVYNLTGDQPFYQGASSVNLIINNFKRQNFFLVGGIGLSLTNGELGKEALDDAFFSFSQGDYHLSAVFKLRGMLQFNKWTFWTTEINVNTLGDDFVTFSTGINYELPQLKARSR